MATQCSDIASLIPTYLDGELADRDLHDFESHIASCAGCAESLRTEDRFHRQMRELLAPPRAPDILRARLSDALDREDHTLERASRRARWDWALPGASIAAAAAALIVFATDAAMPAAPTADEPSASESEKVASNDRLVPSMPLAPMPVVESGRPNQREQPTMTADTIARLASNYIGIPVQVPTFRGMRVTLRGWRPARVDDRQAAEIVFDVETPIAKHLMRLYMMDARGLTSDAADRRTIAGHEVSVFSISGTPAVVYRSPRGIGYMFTGDSNMSEDVLIDVVARSGLLRD